MQIHLRVESAFMSVCPRMDWIGGLITFLHPLAHFQNVVLSVCAQFPTSMSFSVASALLGTRLPRVSFLSSPLLL